MEELIPIIMFIVIGFVISFYLMTRSKERQTLIEKDINVDDLKRLYSKPFNRYNTAKWAFISLFGGIGIFIGIYIAENLSRGEDGYIPASIAVSVGIGLLLWQKIYGDKANDEEN